VQSPPVVFTHEAHHRRYDQDPHYSCVDGNRDGKADADRLDEDRLSGAEGHEHRHHRRRRSSDQAARLLEALGDGAAAVAGLEALLVDPALAGLVAVWSLLLKMSRKDVPEGWPGLSSWLRSFQARKASMLLEPGLPVVSAPPRVNAKTDSPSRSAEPTSTDHRQR